MWFIYNDTTKSIVCSFNNLFDAKMMLNILREKANENFSLLQRQES